jgi:hypothetical protein
MNMCVDYILTYCIKLLLRKPAETPSKNSEEYSTVKPKLLSRTGGTRVSRIAYTFPAIYPHPITNMYLLRGEWVKKN